jgi:opacity protein-like surface antigen
MSHRSVVVVVSLILLCSPVRGEEKETDFARKGAYVGLGFVYAVNDFGLDEYDKQFEGIIGDQQFRVEDDVSQSLGFDVRGGYRFHKHLAAEAQVQYYDDFQIGSKIRQTNLNTGEESKTGLPDGDVQAVAASANLKGYPLTGRVQPYVLTGLGALWTDVTNLPVGNNALEIRRADGSNTSFMVRVGVGVDVYATPHIVFNFEACKVLPTDKTHVARGVNLDLSSVPLAFNLQYRF